MKASLNPKEEQKAHNSKENSETQGSFSLSSSQALGGNPFVPQGSADTNPFKIGRKNLFQTDQSLSNPFLTPIPIQQKAKNNEGKAETIQKNEGQVIQRTTDEQRDRVRLANYVINFVSPLTLAVRALGFEVSGIAVGFRESATAAAGVAGSVGADEMLMFDIANMSFTGDIVPFAELGVGLQAGASVGVVVGLRLSPSGNYGSIRGAYAGPALNAQLQAIAGLGFSISPGLFSGNEGFVATCISLGAEAGGSFSISYALSSSETLSAIADTLHSGINTVVAGISSAARTLGTIGGAVGNILDSMLGEIIVRPVLTARARLDPSNWNLSALPPRARGNLQAIGLYINAILTPDNLNTFLTNLNKPLSDSIYRIPSVLVDELAQGLTQVMRTRGDLFAGVTFTNAIIMRQSPLQLLELLEGYSLLRFNRSPEVIADEQMRQQPPQNAQ